MGRLKRNRPKNNAKTKKTAFLLFVLLVTVVFSCTLLIKNISTKNCLILENGKLVEVNDAWEDGNIVLFKKDGEIRFIEKQAVRTILVGRIKGPKDLTLRVYYHTKKQLLDSFSQTAAGGTLVLPWLRAKNRWVVIVLTLALCGVSFFVLAKIRRKKEKSITPVPEFKRDHEGKSYSLVGISDIENFFLDIFRIQIGASRKDPIKIVRIPGPKSSPEQVYKLHIEHKGEWKSRGMTIAPLGEGSSSKSQCFYVIFDTHMVIKIPPNPIKDFSDYIQRIRYEEQIVGKLNPRECIIPNVSVIINKIKPLSGLIGLSAGQIEERYITMLETSSEYHTYLKIGGNFAFFMNLSQHYFLSHVVDSLHTVEDEIRSVITSDAGLILDCHEFEIKYGRRNGRICLELQKLFRKFDSDLNKLAVQSGTSVFADERQKKEWLFAYLAGQEVTAQQQGLPAEFISKMDILLQKTAGRQPESVKAYRKLAGEYARTRLFKRNRPKIEGMVTNLLVLLAWLGENNVAIRDLKPDNLLVAGNPADYPRFLLSVEKYSVGLIDLETAVDYKPPKNRQLRQPQLGGTPAYATPSHFFKNKIIDDLFHDLPLILHLQDWYAITGIIYKVVTGRRLFVQTGQQIPELIHNLQQGIMENHDILDTCKKVSRMFWKTAVAEFEMKLAEYDNRLKSVNVFFPESMKYRFEKYLLKEKQNIDHQIEARIDTEPMFQKGTYRKQLLGSSYEKIRRTIEKYENSKGTSMLQEESRQQLIEALENLAVLKKRSMYFYDLNSLLNDHLSRLSVKDLLKLMFDIIFSSMYPENWGSLSKIDSSIDGTDRPPPSESDMQDDRTLAYTFTVEYNSDDE